MASNQSATEVPEISQNLYERLRYQSWFLTLLWTGCVAASLLWNVHEERETNAKIARNSAEVTEGDIRGGISVSVPMAALQAIGRQHLAGIWLAHLSLWLVGLAGIVVSRSGLAKQIVGRERAEESLRTAYDELETRVQGRTAELQNTTQLLGAEQQRFHKVLDQLPAYLVLLSPDYHVPFANRFFEERFGKSEGRRCYEYLFHRTEPCENCETYKVLKTDAPHHWEWTGPDGRNYDIFDFPFTDTNGSPLIMEMGIDITKRKQAETALRQLNETLEQHVAERTAELSARNEELSRFNRAAVGRELRMVELKQEVNEVCRSSGQPPRYSLDFEKEQP